jgi:hypothetical protein
MLRYFSRKEAKDRLPTVVDDIDEQIMAHIYEILRLVKSRTLRKLNELI